METSTSPQPTPLFLFHSHLDSKSSFSSSSEDPRGLHAPSLAQVDSMEIATTPEDDAVATAPSPFLLPHRPLESVLRPLASDEDDDDEEEILFEFGDGPISQSMSSAENSGVHHPHLMQPKPPMLPVVSATSLGVGTTTTTTEDPAAAATTTTTTTLPGRTVTSVTPTNAATATENHVLSVMSSTSTHQFITNPRQRATPSPLWTEGPMSVTPTTTTTTTTNTSVVTMDPQEAPTLPPASPPYTPPKNTTATTTSRHNEPTPSPPRESETAAGGPLATPPQQQSTSLVDASREGAPEQPAGHFAYRTVEPPLEAIAEPTNNNTRVLVPTPTRPPRSASSPAHSSGRRSDDGTRTSSFHSVAPDASPQHNPSGLLTPTSSTGQHLSFRESMQAALAAASFQTQDDDDDDDDSNIRTAAARILAPLPTVVVGRTHHNNNSNNNSRRSGRSTGLEDPWRDANARTDPPVSPDHDLEHGLAATIAAATARLGAGGLPDAAVSLDPPPPIFMTTHTVVVSGDSMSSVSSKVDHRPADAESALTLVQSLDEDEDDRTPQWKPVDKFGVPVFFAGSPVACSLRTCIVLVAVTFLGAGILVGWGISAWQQNKDDTGD